MVGGRDAHSSSLMEPKEHPVANSKLHIVTPLIVMLPHSVLGKNKTITDLGQECVAIPELVINSSHTCSAWRVGH